MLLILLFRGTDGNSTSHSCESKNNFSKGAIHWYSLSLSLICKLQNNSQCVVVPVTMKEQIACLMHLGSHTPLWRWLPVGWSYHEGCPEAGWWVFRSPGIRVAQHPLPPWSAFLHSFSIREMWKECDFNRKKTPREFQAAKCHRFALIAFYIYREGITVRTTWGPSA